MAFMLALLCLATASSVSPVQKVIQLLDELKAKVEADLAGEEKAMEEYTAWCDEESNSKEDAITSSKRTINDLSATIEDAKGTIATLTSTVEDLTSKISASESDLADATKIRNKENKDFLAAEKELVDTADGLDRAVTVLKRNMAFMQAGNFPKKEMSLLATSLSKIIEASWVNEHDRKVVQSLLQTSDGDEDLSFQPQATTSSYSSQSGGIVDTLEDMKEKAEESLSSTRKDEMEAAHAFALLKQSLEDEISVSKKQLSQATLQKSNTEEELHAAEEDLTTTKKVLSDDESYLAELKESCSAKATAWSIRQKDAGEETAAIEKAKEILSTGVKVFLQTSSMTRTKDEDVETAQRRAAAVRTLRALAKKYNTFGLLELSMSAKSDPFGKIRGLIEGMIAKLTKEAAEEADLKSFCDEETAESKKKQADLSAKLDKTNARIAKAVAAKAKLTEDIKVLEEQIAEIDAADAEATKIRGEEHEEYLKSSKDLKDSAEAVAKAISVLTEYYSSASFVQTKAAEEPEFASNKGDIASTITSMLEVAESDLSKLLAETEAGESSALAAFEELTKENKVSKATKMADAKGKAQEVKSTDVALSNYKEDKTSLTSELDAVMAYLDKLKPQCETKVMSYAERKAKREAEIEGLKEALTILSETAFLQVKSTLRGARRA
jgi:DNA repair exonuclease SbcCD ATPase subunit